MSTYILHAGLYLLVLTACTHMSRAQQYGDVTRKQLIVQAIHEELALHPKATLQDLYKAFFQGSFGPGHMIENASSAQEYLLKEIEQATEYDSVLWQSVGYEKQYYRVNLRLVRDGKLPAEELITAFTASANSATPPSLEAWMKEWQDIVGIVGEMGLNLANFRNDKQRIEENLRNGLVACHHSEVYRNTYHPHYRIVSKEHYEMLRGAAGR